ncbi:MAG: M14 family zinc carboxypeptidase, partial [Pseudomonadota bacterium]
MGSVNKRWGICLMVTLLAGCQLAGSGAPVGVPPSAQPQSTQQTACRTGEFVVHGEFDGSRLGACRVTPDNTIVLTNAPEDEPINHSPWYAFQVASGEGELRVRIEYTLHQHRYWPKVSNDGNRWQRLSAERIEVAADGRSVTLRLKKGTAPLWVAGQELLTSDYYTQWYRQLRAEYGASMREIGKSVAGRPLHVLETNPGARHTLMLVGRQHPPEVSGALGMYHFIQRLLEGYHQDNCRDPALCEFYQQFNLVMVPLMNPDGVALGHWRHGLGGLDLNRDWGPFSQPETRAVRDEIERLVRIGKPPVAFLDFHSTQKNVFYTQSPVEEAQHNNFASRWLERAARSGTYEFSQEARHNQGRPTSKNYMFERFGIPAITYEVGDETDRTLIRTSAEVFADTLVELLLEDYVYPTVEGSVDVLIRGGQVIDGSAEGGDPNVEIEINGQRIVYVGPGRNTPAHQVIDASGLVVSPGFIDPHTHMLSALKNPADAVNRPYLFQGVTTVFVGNDGAGGGMPVGPLRKHLETMPLGTNVGLWSGHGHIRTAVMGPAARAPNPDELGGMQAMLDAEMRAGSLGLSTGLFYAPGSFARTEEVVALARVAAAYGGIYDTHIRDESDYNVGLVPAVAEVLEIAESADIAAHIAHIKALGPNVHGQSRSLVDMVTQARQRGLRVTADQYPWLASGTRLSNALIPRQVMDGGVPAMQARLRDPEMLASMRPQLALNLQRRGGAQALLVTGKGPYQGQTLAALAQQSG